MTIFKYRLDPASELIAMPEGAYPIAVQMQHGHPHLWAEVDPKAPSRMHRIGVYGTGHELHSGPRRYVGTFQIQVEGLVFHVYDLGEQPTPRTTEDA